MTHQELKLLFFKEVQRWVTQMLAKRSTPENKKRNMRLWKASYEKCLSKGNTKYDLDERRQPK